MHIQPYKYSQSHLTANGDVAYHYRVEINKVTTDTSLQWRCLFPLKNTYAG